MSAFSKPLVIIALFVAVLSVSAHARGTGRHANDAKYYGPVYGWRYYPPPPATAVPEPACRWTAARIVRNGHTVTRRVRRC